MLPEVACCKENSSSTDGEVSSTWSMGITAFDEGGCMSVLYETENVAVEAGEAQLLEAEDELAGPIKEAKKVRLSKISFSLVNVTHFQWLALQN